jgi:5-methylcytosine-specific restriction enzyme A
MPYCLQPGCSALVPRGRCRLHAGRPNAAAHRLYHTQRWQRLRRQVLIESAYACAQCGAVALELDVDHIQKHQGDPQLFWSRANLQALCAGCHTRKTRAGH